MSKKEFSFERLKFPLSELFNQIRQILKSEEDFRETTSAEDVRRLWSEHLRNLLPPCPWTAFWKPSQVCKTTPSNSSLNCEVTEVNIFVDVIKINWLTLSANVEILGKGDVKEDLPLVELFGPLQLSEDDDQFDVAAPKIALEQLHFFLSHLWLPWDEDDDDEDEGSDWVEHHLENRFQIYRSYIENGPDGDVYLRLGRLAKQYSEASETVKQIKANQVDADDELVEDELISLHELEKRCDDIKREADILENPSLRSAFESNRLRRKRSVHLSGKVNCFVWPGGSFNEMSQFLHKVSQLSGFDSFANTIVCSSLQEAISKSLPNDTIYLPSGVHTITDLGDLKDGGVSIVGLNLVETFIEIDGNNLTDSFGLPIGGGGANFEGVSINALNSSESALLLRSGTTFLNKVHVSGFKVGIKILSGAALVARRCEIFDCNRGLVIESGACVQALDVDIFHNKIGIVLNNREGENIKLERVNCRCDQDIVIVDEYFENSDAEMRDGDFLSKTIVTDSSLGECKMVASLND